MAKKTIIKICFQTKDVRHAKYASTSDNDMFLECILLSHVKEVSIYLYPLPSIVDEVYVVE